MGNFTGWSRQMYAMMADGGTWAVPRSGLVFQKNAAERKLVLTARMPHDEAMPMTAQELDDYQREDFKVIKEEFGKVGVLVLDENRLL